MLDSNTIARQKEKRRQELYSVYKKLNNPDYLAEAIGSEATLSSKAVDGRYIVTPSLKNALINSVMAEGTNKQADEDRLLGELIRKLAYEYLKVEED